MKPVTPAADRHGATAVPPGATVASPVDTPVVAHVSGSSIVKQDHAGQLLGDFRLERRLGEGGMGQVYLAQQLSLQRRVAIKLLRSDFAENESFLKRFEAEAKAIAQLAHPNIVQVYAVGNEQGCRYMALEYVEGTNLKDYLYKKGPPELPIALVIMRQIAAALLKASELGIIHRDIKPENILITRKVEVKVADFGLSRIVGDDVHLTQTGTTMGTPLYMSPEQLLGKPVDPRTDLYSFGATCYHLLTGQPPFMADSAMAVGVRHLTDAVKPIEELRPDLPVELRNLVHSLLAKKPEDRPQTAREVLRAIRKIQESMAGIQTQAMSKAMPELDTDTDHLDFEATLPKAMPVPVSALDAPKQRRWLLPLVGGSVMVAIIGGAAFGLMLRNDGHAQTKVSASSTGLKIDAKKTMNAAIQEFENKVEKKLKEKVDETRYQRDPSKPLDPFPVEKMVLGVQKRAELMRFYVKNLDDKDEGIIVRARQFAEQEIQAQQAPDTYRCVGYIGQAVLFSYEGKYKESYEALEHTFALRPNANPKRALQTQMLRNKDLVELLALAFKMNEAHLPIPASLKPLKEELDKIEKGIPPEKRSNKT
ncbi:MAG TPA: serine/threonine-protein kinase [Gemmatales bacterium]|nr:serine/threonine-protein kinase [Gemmatales bacterium]